MSRAKRTDNDYRFEMLEKRLDTLERLILSKNDNNLNQDLLQLVLSMIKNNNISQPSPSSIPQPAKKQAPAKDDNNDDVKEISDVPSELDKSKVGFYRRVAIM